MVHIRGKIAVGILLVLGLSLVLPAAPAQAPPSPSASTLFQMYVSAEGFNKPFIAGPLPEGASSKTSVLGPASTPGLSYFVKVATFKPDADIVATSDIAPEGWFVADTATSVSSIGFAIFEGATEKARGSTPNSETAPVQTTPTRYSAGIAFRGVELKADTEYSLQVIVFATAAPGSPTGVFLTYGSAAHPSGITFTASAPAGLPVGGSPLAVYLADKALSLSAPTSEEDQSRTAEGSSLGSSTPFNWGDPAKMASSYVVSGPTILGTWVTISGNAGAMRSISATMTVNDVAKSQSRGVTTSNWQSASGAATVSRAVFTFDTRGMEIPAGAEIKLSFKVESSSDTPAGSVVFKFGSVGRPAGLVFPVTGAGSGPVVGGPLDVSADSLSSTVPPGATATYTLTVTNPAADNVSFVANVSALPQGFTASLDPATGTLGPNESAPVIVSVSVRADASEQTTTFNATIEGPSGTTSSVTLTLIVSKAAPIPTTATSASAPPSNTSGPAGNSTSETSGAPGSKAGTPSLSMVLGLLVVCGVVFAARRRT